MPAKSPRIARAALTDLEEIWLYIAIDNPSAADKMLDQLYEHIDRLGSNPHLGHLRTDLAKEPLRFWPVRHYMIIYRPDTNQSKLYVSSQVTATFKPCSFLDRRPSFPTFITVPQQ